MGGDPEAGRIDRPLRGALVTQLSLRGVPPSAGSGVEGLCSCLEIPHVPLGRALAEAEELGQLDFVVVEGVPAADRVFLELASRLPRTRLVYWVEGRLGGLAGISSQDALLQVKAVAAADLVAVVSENTIPYYRLLTGAPVVWWGLPYYEHVTRGLALAPEKRDPDLMAIGAPPSAAAKNGLASALVAVRCGLRVLVFGAREDEDALRAVGAVARVVPITGSINAAREVAAARVAVHLDPRDTWGRFSLDCAAVGVPCVGSSRVEAQRRLFPRLTLDWLDGEGAVALVKRLLSDQALYDESVAAAQEELTSFGYDATLVRIAATLA